MYGTVECLTTIFAKGPSTCLITRSVDLHHDIEVHDILFPRVSRKVDSQNGPDVIYALTYVLLQ